MPIISLMPDGFSSAASVACAIEAGAAGFCAAADICNAGRILEVGGYAGIAEFSRIADEFALTSQTPAGDAQNLRRLIAGNLRSNSASANAAIGAVRAIKNSEISAERLAALTDVLRRFDDPAEKDKRPSSYDQTMELAEARCIRAYWHDGSVFSYLRETAAFAGYLNQLGRGIDDLSEIDLLRRWCRVISIAEFLKDRWVNLEYAYRARHGLGNRGLPRHDDRHVISAKRLGLIEEAAKKDAELDAFFDRAQLGIYKPLRRLGYRLQGKLFERLKDDPALAREIICIFHATGESIDDWMLDRVMGIDSDRVERVADFGRPAYRDEQFCYGATPYGVARSMANFLQMGPDDVFYDLGAGYGRVALYMAINTKARVKAVELVTERAGEMEKARSRLGIANMEVINASALDCDLSDGTVFFMFSPFSLPVVNRVAERLAELAGRKKIKIVTLGMDPALFRGAGSALREQGRIELDSYSGWMNSRPVALGS